MVVLFILCLFVNVGMWFERFVIIVTSLAHPFEPATWDVNYKHVVDRGRDPRRVVRVVLHVLPDLRPACCRAFSIAEIKETLAGARCGGTRMSLLRPVET